MYTHRHTHIYAIFRFLRCLANGKLSFYSNMSNPPSTLRNESPGKLQIELYSPSLSEAFAEWILSERSGTFNRVARSSL